MLLLTTEERCRLGQQLCSRAAGQLGRRLWDTLLAAATTPEQHAQPSYPPGSAVHARQTRLWQALAALAPFGTVTSSPLEARALADRLMTFLKVTLRRCSRPCTALAVTGLEAGLCGGQAC